MIQKDLKGAIENAKSNDEAVTQEDKKQFVTFVLDEEEYAIPITDLREIVKTEEITPVPNAPEFISGILNLRGQIVVVLDLEKRFNLNRNTEGEVLHEHTIIIDVEGNIFGVLVDQVQEVIRIPVSSIQKTPALVSSKIHEDFLEGVIVLGDDLKKGDSDKKRLLVILNLPKILDEKELLDIGELSKKDINNK
ncbi:chemotaxis protein CheW [Candidatus Kaiserbacteria bacterium]|nr:MAG: chemotaxis protein CheW [Candidatus Kaiserbacteria bacterium]